MKLYFRSFKRMRLNRPLGLSGLVGYLAAYLLTFLLSTAGAASVFEGAENGNGGFTMQVPAGYELITAAVNGGAGSHSFHFAHPIGANSIYPEDQWLMLNGQVVPAIGSRLQFKSRLTYSGGAQDAQVQVSSNGGATWQDLWTQTGTNSAGEGSFGDQSVSLDGYAGQSIRIRFRYHFEVARLGEGFYPQTTNNAGWFVDEIRVLTGGNTVWFEGAENGFNAITVQIPAGYNLINSAVYASANTRCFHFAHPVGTNSIYPEDQWLMLTPTLVPGSGSELQFESMLRYAGGAQFALVQVSSDGGGAWQDLFSQSGDNSSGAQVFSQKVISLARYQGQSIKVRFLYHFAEALLGNGFYPQTTLNAGWFVDDITVSNVSVGAPVATVPVITQQPAAQTTVLEGAAVTWSVTATGTAPLSYQWQKDGVAIPGATTNTLNLPQVALAAAGTYTLLISNSAGSLPSNPAALMVNGRPIINITSAHLSKDPVFALSGTATNGSSLGAITVNGQSAVTSDGFRNWSIPDLRLSPGNNVLTVSITTRPPATDIAPSVTWEVYYATPANVLSYAFDAEEGAGEFSGMPELRSGQSVIANGFIDYSFRRRIDTPNLQYGIELSSDLKSWAAAQPGEIAVLSAVRASDSEVCEVVTVRVSLRLGETRRFVRLRVAAL